MPTRLIPLDEVRASEHYADMADLAEIFGHDIVEDTGIWRWKQNALARWMRDCSERFFSQQLNAMCADAYRGAFSVEEWMKFNMQIGYSLCGFEEVFGQREATEFKLPDAVEDETLIEYMVRMHKGKTLRL
jgi:hypothetical protein